MSGADDVPLTDPVHLFPNLSHLPRRGGEKGGLTHVQRKTKALRRDAFERRCGER